MDHDLEFLCRFCMATLPSLYGGVCSQCSRFNEVFQGVFVEEYCDGSIWLRYPGRDGRLTRWKPDIARSSQTSGYDQRRPSPSLPLTRGYGEDRPGLTETTQAYRYAGQKPWVRGIDSFTYADERQVTAQPERSTYAEDRPWMMTHPASQQLTDSRAPQTLSYRSQTSRVEKNVAFMTNPQYQDRDYGPRVREVTRDEDIPRFSQAQDTFTRVTLPATGQKDRQQYSIHTNRLSRCVNAYGNTLTGPTRRPPSEREPAAGLTISWRDSRR